TVSWAAEVQSQQLRRFVVRVDTEDEQGTGFFVAPGWVLTCAHVVNTAKRVTVVPAPGARSVPATVEARSAPPEGRSVFWPFPDLALVRLDTTLDHPCVLLDTRLPAKGWCDSWGHAERESGVEPTGSPVSFRFEGVEGDDYLTLEAGQAAPGLSGAPLVCPSRRAVVGVMVMTRDKRDARGGWAAPISALLTGGPGVPDDLLALGTEILRANRAAVLADRAAWHRVVPVAGSEEVLPPKWGTFRKKRRSDPADLLLAEYGVVPYLFRETDLKAAISWCDSAQALAVSVVPGRGGAGKTRFAMELCQRMKKPDHDWVCGMWNTTQDVVEVATLPLPRLIVVDYTESADLPALRSLLDRLGRQATDTAPARVLLLTRAGAAGARETIPTLREDATPSVKQILDDSDVSTAASDPLAHDQRDVLYREAVAAFAVAWQVNPTPVVPDLSAPGYSLALEVLFEALDQTLNNGDDGSEAGPPPAPGPVVGPPVRSPAERVLGHEAKYWAADCPIDDAQLRRACVTLATLAGAANTAEANALISLLPALRGDHPTADRRRVTDWLAGLYDGASLLNPLRPDRLGEALVSTMLRDQADAVVLLAAVFSLDSDDQVAQALEVLARLAVNDHWVAGALAEALAGHHADLLERAEAQRRGRPGQPGRLRLASVLIRIHTGPVAQRIAAVPPAEHIRALGVTYEQLGNIAEQTGQPTEAHTLYRQSLAIDRRLAEAEPGNTVYQRDLSISYE
ncbi:MAG: trypsin-like peptidase domain-containing protein, partial [Pseudonocardiaceae bacterium]